jgi:peptidoglycan-N-acetylglucosamine deacetylase
MSSQQAIASLSLDLDNQWSYLKVHGDSGWEEFPSYLDLFVPRVLEFLSLRNLKITFFVVGQDAALEKNQTPLRAIAKEKHEIGNHSFSHEPWLHLFPVERIEQEIQSTEDQIVAITGERPIGFRGPGFSFSDATFQVLEQRGYLYDATTFPTFLGPLARSYYFLHSNLTRRNHKERDFLFGSFWQGLRPLKPYRWHGNGGLLEIPVTTMPIIRTPIHLSYILYLSLYSSFLALEYFRVSLLLCRWAGISPSLLLHPLDFLGQDDNLGLSFFPAMNLCRSRKLGLVSEVLRMLCDEFQVVSVREHAMRIANAHETGMLGGHSYSKLSAGNNQ